MHGSQGGNKPGAARDEWPVGARSAHAREYHSGMRPAAARGGLGNLMLSEGNQSPSEAHTLYGPVYRKSPE